MILSGPSVKGKGKGEGLSQGISIHMGGKDVRLPAS